jgi:GT2 family glycosyltransferase
LKPKFVKKVVFNDVGDFRYSPVDILIPFHGQYTQVRNLVESILLHTKSNPYRICLIDDCSPNSNFITTIATQAILKTIRLEKQRGFAGALKVGFENSTSPWIVFLHSDCLITNPYWLGELGESIMRLRDLDVRLVHARTDNPMADNPYLPASKEEDQIDDVIVADEEPLPLIAAMMHRDLFSYIGGFLKEYPYAWYENVELFYRMRHVGFKQAVCGRSWVHHIGGLTVNKIMKNKKIRKIIEGNYDLCMKDITKKAALV